MIFSYCINVGQAYIYIPCTPLDSSLFVSGYVENLVKIREFNVGQVFTAALTGDAGRPSSTSLTFCSVVPKSVNCTLCEVTSFSGSLRLLSVVSDSEWSDAAEDLVGRMKIVGLYHGNEFPVHSTD